MQLVIERISNTIRNEAIPNENSPYKFLTLSIGVINVNVKENTKTIIDLVKIADKAMYHAKNDGKNTIYLLDYNVDNDLDFIKVDL